MSNPVSHRMHILKKVFFVLLVLDAAELVSAGIAMSQTFRQLAGSDRLMLGIVGGVTALMAAVLLFEILAKVFLIRSTAPTFSWASCRKGYTTAAKLLVLVNLGAVLVNLLSAGGEGATLLSQGRVYLQILISVAEIIAAFCYLRAVKKRLACVKEETP